MPGKKPVEYDVIIVGAGISGVSAAKTLNRNGITNYLILEAQNVVGGRMKKGKIGGVNVELGAQYIQGLGGDKMNPLKTYSNKLKLTTVEVDFEDGPIYKDDGTLLEDGERVSDFENALEAVTEKYSEKPNAKDVSLRKGLSSNGWTPKNYTDSFHEWIGIEEEYAATVDDLSSKRTLTDNTFTDFGDGNELVRDQRGFQLIPETILEEAKGKNKVRFNTLVQTIDYSGCNVQISTNNGLFSAKRVILTVSLRVLQKNKIIFKPLLPPKKANAISKFKMGAYYRVWMNFPTRFWDESTFLFYASKKGKGYYAEYLNGMQKGLYGASGIKVKGNLLQLTLSGKLAENEEAALNDKQISEKAMEVLRKIFGGYIPRPTEVLSAGFERNPLFLGSFTYWPIGFTDKDHDNLCKNVDGKVFFSGEMTSRRYFGYAHGALLAGSDTAEEIVKCVKTLSCKVGIPSK